MTGGHAHGATGVRNRRPLLVALLLGLAVLVAEVVGAWLSGSLALLADAGHVVTDVAGIALALAAVTYAQRPPTPTRTFGTLRAEVLAAAVNGLVLLAVATYVVVEAIRRWNEEDAVDGGLMLAFGVLGLVANAIALAVLSRGARESLNVRGAYLEVLGDLLGSIAVIVAAVVIALTGWDRADVVASLVIAALMVPRTLSLLRDVVHVLLEGTPRGVDLAEVRRHITEVDGVLGVHELHAWTITSGVPVLSAHVVVDDEVFAQGRTGPLLDRLTECLEGCFEVEHCTFQLEPAEHARHEDADHA